MRWSSPCRECIFAKLLREELCSQKVEQKARRDLLEIGGDGRTDGDGRGPSHVGTGTQWGAWALTHNAPNHLEALFSIGLNCRGASKKIGKGKYLEPSSMSKPPSRTSNVSIIKIFEKKELPDDDGFFLVKVKEVVLRAGDELGQV